MINRKFLILVPGANARGGISNYYQIIRKYLPDNVYYFIRGARNWPYHSNFIAEFIRIFNDYIKFIHLIIKLRIDVIQTTTSLGRGAIIRDSIFILISKILRVKSIVFFRGWNPENENIFIKSFLFRSIFFSVNSIICLSRHTKNFLIMNGYKGPVFIDTTLVDKNIFNEIDENFIKSKYSVLNEIRILFLSRIEKEKGIYEALDTFLELKKTYPFLRLYIAGDGRIFNDIRTKIEKEELKDIFMTGHLTGLDKYNIFKTSHIYFFPSYTEGMPNSVLEAMGFGLPIIAHNVGGLKDILHNSVNGYLSDSVDVKVFVRLFSKLISNEKEMSKIGLTNYNCAKNKFSSEVVAMRLLKIFEET